MPEFTHEESKLARELWCLRSSPAFLDGDKDTVAEVKDLEGKLAASVRENMTPEERYDESVQKLGNE